MNQSEAQAKYAEFQTKIKATERPGLIGMAAGLERLQLQNDLNHFRSQYQAWGITLLEPCPFCGSYDVSPTRIGFDQQSISCNDCDSYGPERENPESAIAAWNKRVK